MMHAPLFALAIVAQAVSPTEWKVERIETFAEMSDSAKVLIIDRVPLGSPVETLHLLAMGLEATPEGVSSRSIRLFGLPAFFSATLTEGHVESMHFAFDVLPSRAAGVFAAIDAVYSSRWGVAFGRHDGQMRERSWQIGSLQVYLSDWGVPPVVQKRRCHGECMEMFHIWFIRTPAERPG